MKRLIARDTGAIRPRRPMNTKPGKPTEGYIHEIFEEYKDLSRQLILAESYGDEESLAISIRELEEVALLEGYVVYDGTSLAPLSEETFALLGYDEDMQEMLSRLRWERSPKVQDHAQEEYAKYMEERRRRHRVGTPTVASVPIADNRKQVNIHLSCGHSQTVKRGRKEKRAENGIEILLARMTAMIGKTMQCPGCQRKEALEAKKRAPYDYVMCPFCQAIITLPEGYFSPVKHMLDSFKIVCPNEECGEDIDIVEAWEEAEAEARDAQEYT